MWASVVAARGVSSCGSQALEYRLNSCGAQAQLLFGVWDLAGSLTKPVSPALVGGFFTIVPPGKPNSVLYGDYLCCFIQSSKLRNKRYKLWKSESEVAQSCLTLCNPMDYGYQASPSMGFFQTRILEWVAVPFSKGSSQPRDQTQVSCIACRRFTLWATRNT